MAQHIAGPWPATDIKLARLAARIRDDYESIATFLEDAVADIETFVLPGGVPRAEGLLDKLRHTLAGIHCLSQSGAPDLTAVAAIERDLTELYRDLGALRDAIPEDA